MTVFIGSIVGAILFVFQVVGVVAATHALLSTRTSQGAIAWGISLLVFPLISVPLYLVFGRSRFNGVVNARRADNLLLADITKALSHNLADYEVDLGSDFGDAHVLNKLTNMPFLRGNQTRLLVDGEATFEAMFAAIGLAQDYVIAEFYIVNDDELGRQFKTQLIAAAHRGCRVYLLFDEVGSKNISRSYLADLSQAGIHVSGMKATQGFFNRFQLNFRNHRKILVVDGKCAFVGGLNVGDEYIHKSKRLTPWRDTHMRIDGPAVLAIQFAFVEDWLWATREIPQLNWEATPAEDADKTLFVFPSGPDDDYETCGMFFTHAINCAKRRLWIASPYFVPDEGIITALQLAAMRGVDVRVLIPGLADKWIVKQAALSYVPEVAAAGVKMYEYGNGFLHQKACIIDDSISVIGTANFDNRSFRLNFEIAIVTIDESFSDEVEQMFKNDLALSTLINPQELAQRGLPFKISSRVARLFSPIL